MVHNYVDYNSFVLYTDAKCFDSGEPVPIIDGLSNQTTVEQEMIVFGCVFKANYSPNPKKYNVFWMITFQNGSDITVRDDSNFSDYRIDSRRNCSYDNYSCCRSITELYIHTARYLNNSMINCTATYNSIKSTNGSYLGESFTIIIIIHYIAIVNQRMEQ